MDIPFIKAHGARNDFLLSWADELPPAVAPEDIAAAICDRHAGVGADGWIRIDRRTSPVSIQLWNPDRSLSEISGNGTRCVAALLVATGLAGGSVTIATGAGDKHLHLLRRDGNRFEFRMNMGVPEMEDPDFALPLSSGVRNVTILRVGNPQCAVPVENFAFDWRAAGKEIEWHQRFPSRTNVSFVRRSGSGAIEVRFWERGAGETLSSGTGSTGAAAAAIARGWVASPVTVETPAGPLLVEWPGAGDAFLTGPAEIVAEGRYRYQD
jgi:diaminopimelate epimerase